MSSGSGSGSNPPGGSEPTPTTSGIEAALMGAAANWHRQRRDRTRSRSPHLATPNDGDATPSGSDASPRNGNRRDAIVRDGNHRDVNPRDAKPRHAKPRDAKHRDAKPRDVAAGEGPSGEGASGHGTPRDGNKRVAKKNTKFSHILIKHKESRRPIDKEDRPVTRTKTQAMDLVIDIHEKITRDLITFADAAVSFSDCTSARREGDIQPQFKTGRVQKSFDNAAQTLTPGQISDIIESNSGYHILQHRSE